MNGIETHPFETERLSFFKDERKLEVMRGEIMIK
jgi:hypothetical protein